MLKCECDDCRKEIDSRESTYCESCVEELKNKVTELEDKVKELEDEVKCLDEEFKKAEAERAEDILDSRFIDTLQSKDNSQVV